MTQQEKEAMLNELKAIKLPFFDSLDTDYRDGFYDGIKKAMKVIKAKEVEQA